MVHLDGVARQLVRLERVGDAAAHVTHAEQHDRRDGGARGGLAGRHQSHGAAAQRAGQTVPERGQRRGERQAGGNAGDDHADGTLAERRAHRRQRDDHERELAALGEQKPELDRAGVDQPKARAASATRNALSAINAARNTRICAQSARRSRQSSDMPTVMKKKPSSRSRNGLASVWITWR